MRSRCPIRKLFPSIGRDVFPQNARFELPRFKSLSIDEQRLAVSAGLRMPTLPVPDRRFALREALPWAGASSAHEAVSARWPYSSVSTGAQGVRMPPDVFAVVHPLEANPFGGRIR